MYRRFWIILLLLLTLLPCKLPDPSILWTHCLNNQVAAPTSTSTSNAVSEPGTIPQSQRTPTKYKKKETYQLGSPMQAFSIKQVPKLVLLWLSAPFKFCINYAAKSWYQSYEIFQAAERSKWMEHNRKKEMESVTSLNPLSDLQQMNGSHTYNPLPVPSRNYALSLVQTDAGVEPDYTVLARFIAPVSALAGGSKAQFQQGEGPLMLPSAGWSAVGELTGTTYEWSKNTTSHWAEAVGSRVKTPVGWGVNFFENIHQRIEQVTAAIKSAIDDVYAFFVILAILVFMYCSWKNNEWIVILLLAIIIYYIYKRLVSKLRWLYD